MSSLTNSITQFLKSQQPKALKKLKFLVLFYLFVPALLGLSAGLSFSGSQSLNSSGSYIFFWTASIFHWWLAIGLGTALISMCCRAFKLPLFIILILGFLVGTNAIWMPSIGFRNDLFEVLHLSDQTLQHPLERASIWVILYQILIGVANWLGFNYLFGALFKVPIWGRTVDLSALNKILGYVSDKGEKSVSKKRRKSEARLELEDRISPLTFDAISSMHAEDHYTCIYSGSAKKLIYMSLSKAVLAAQPLDGLRTHRSHWVRKSAIKAMVKQKGKWFVETYSGQSVPITRQRRTDLERVLTAPEAA